MRPWSRGYSEYRTQELNKVLASEELMQVFAQSKPLPEGYGFRLDERIIEYPWVLSRLPKEPFRLLDAGSILNFDYIINHPTLSNKDISILTFFPEALCFWKERISYLYTDLRDTPFRDNYFDYIICISTLEHIGMDSHIYTSGKLTSKKDPDSFTMVIEELDRILKPRGTLFLTVPYGKYVDFGFFQQFDASLVKKAINFFAGSLTESSYYRYLDSGWVISTSSECLNCDYFNIHETKYFDKQSNKDYDKDYAAAARAIACLRLLKSE
ncbi:class I SAM-dependent methyltransferase [Chloroflexota bacterium]